MHDRITDEIVSILTAKLKVNKALLTESVFNEPLAGPVMQLQGTDLAYLFCFVQEAFGIRIPEEYVLDYKFNTINGIRNAVIGCMKQ